MSSIDLSSSFNNAFSLAFLRRIEEKAGISAEVATEVVNYFQAHQQEWNDQLHNGAQESLLLRHRDTKLPYTIEYWKTGELLLHTKKSVGSGGQKKVMVSIDLLNQSLLARAKGNGDFVLQEAHFIDLLAGRGIVKKYKDSYYTSKEGLEKGNIAKYAMMLELYDGTINEIANLPLTQEDIQAGSLDLAIGLARVHKKGILHNDYKVKNIFYKINAETNKLNIVLGDFGSANLRSHENSLQDNQKLEINEVERMICEIIKIYVTVNVDPPSCLNEALTINTLYRTRDSNKSLFDRLVHSLETVPIHDQPITAKQLVVMLEDHYKN